MSFNRHLPLIAGLVLVLSAAQRGNAATFTVDSNANTTDALPGDGICDDGSGACTVYAAVEEANALAGADTISVPGGTFVSSASLMIADDLEIAGAGLDVTVLDGDKSGPGPHYASSVIQVQDGVTAVVRDLTVQHGDNYGGGIFNDGDLTAINVGVRDNSSPNVGGGIYSEPGARLTLIDAVVTGNFAVNSGGGLHSEGALSITGSTFSGNSAGNVGGGIATYGSVAATNSTFSGNQAGNTGGGAHIDGGFSVNNCTFTANIARNVGGGISVGDDGSASVRNSILYGNVSRMPDCEGNVSSGGHNLIGNLTGCDLTAAPSDQIGVDPLLGPLQDNGGQTPTHALDAGSPAIDAGGSDCDGADQRGLPRPQGAACDAGAYERVACNWDGVVDAGEDCDDGNNEDGDGCSALCQTELLAGASLRIAIAPTGGGRMTTTAKDDLIRLGWGNRSADDPVLHGARLVVRGAAGSAFDMVYDLPAANWSYIGRAGRNRGYRYRDEVGAIGSILVRPGRVIRVKGNAGDPGMTMNINPAPVDVGLTMGTRTFSTTFGGQTVYRAGRDYRARNAPPPASPPL